MSKQDEAVRIYREEMEKVSASPSIRQRVIGRIETELGMSTAGASTYCANAKKIIEQGGTTPPKQPKVKAATVAAPQKPFVPKPMPDDIDVLYSAVKADTNGIAQEVSCWRDRECAELEAKQKKWHFVIGTQKVGEAIGVVEKGSTPKKGSK